MYFLYPCCPRDTSKDLDIFCQDWYKLKTAFDLFRRGFLIVEYHFGNYCPGSHSECDNYGPVAFVYRCVMNRYHIYSVAITSSGVRFFFVATDLVCRVKISRVGSKHRIVWLVVCNDLIRSSRSIVWPIGRGNILKSQTCINGGISNII